MFSDMRQSVRVVTAGILLFLFAFPIGLLAQSHVVSPSEIQNQMVTATQERQHHADAVRQFLSSPKAEKALKSARIDPEQVKTAVSTLSDAELAQLASRAEKAQAEFAAGTLSDRDLILIILAIAVLVLLIVAIR
jgi:hypothetical protein